MNDPLDVEGDWIIVYETDITQTKLTPRARIHTVNDKTYAQILSLDEDFNLYDNIMFGDSTNLIGGYKL